MLRRLVFVCFGLLCALHLPVAHARRPSPAARAFAEGRRLFDEADYLGAIEAFLRAYTLRPHFHVLCNIAHCHERRGELVRSAQYYKRCLREGGHKSPDVEAIRNSLHKVDARISWIDVRSTSGGIVHVDGKVEGPAPRRVALDPGTHVIEVRRAGATPATTTVVARGGEQRSLALEPRALTPERITVHVPMKTPRRRVHKAWFWTLASAAVATAAVGVFFGVRTMRLGDDYRKTPTRELFERGQNARLLTNVLWAGAATFGATATVLFVFTDFRASSGARHDELSAGLGVRGSF